MWSAAVRMSYILLVVWKTLTHLYGFSGETFKLMMIMIIVEWSRVRFRTPGPGQLNVRLVRSLYSNQEIILIMQLKPNNRRVLDKHKAVLSKSRTTLNLTLKALKNLSTVSTCYERWGPLNTLLCDYKLGIIPHDKFPFSLFSFWSSYSFQEVGGHLREADVTHLCTNQRRATFELEIDDIWSTRTTPKHSKCSRLGFFVFVLFFT